MSRTSQQFGSAQLHRCMDLIIRYHTQESKWRELCFQIPKLSFIQSQEWMTKFGTDATTTRGSYCNCIWIYTAIGGTREFPSFWELICIFSYCVDCKSRSTSYMCPQPEIFTTSIELHGSCKNLYAVNDLIQSNIIIEQRGEGAGLHSPQPSIVGKPP